MKYPHLRKYDLPHSRKTKRIDELSKSIKPIARSTYNITHRDKRSVVALAEKVGNTTAAFVYDIAVSSLHKWRKIYEPSDSSQAS